MLKIGRLTTNFGANVIGVGAAAVAQLAFTPVYLHLLGVESYALIGLLVTVQSLVQLLDLGIASTVSREVARYSVAPRSAEEMRHFIRTFEIVYFALAAILFVGLAAASNVIAHYWFPRSGLSPDVIRGGIVRIAATCSLQFAVAFYAAGFMGLQRQMTTNALRAASVLGANVAATGILLFVARDLFLVLDAFVLTAALQLLAMAALFWRAMPRGASPLFSPDLLRRLIAYASSVTFINTVGIALTQFDKLAVTKLFPLREAGYYMVGSVAGSAVVALIIPLFNTTFPAFSALVAEQKEAELRDLYHRIAQISAVLIVPTAAVVAIFSYDIVHIWTRSAEAAAHSAPVVALIATGFALNGLMVAPFALQLAYGKTYVGVALAGLQLAVFVPVLLICAKLFGVTGAAAAWPASNLAYVVIGVPLTHRVMLRGEAVAWIVHDVGLPSIAALAVIMILRFATAGTMTTFAGLAVIAAALCAGFAAATAAAPRARASIRAVLRPV